MVCLYRTCNLGIVGLLIRHLRATSDAEKLSVSDTGAQLGFYFGVGGGV